MKYYNSNEILDRNNLWYSDNVVKFQKTCSELYKWTDQFYRLMHLIKFYTSNR